MQPRFENEAGVCLELRCWVSGVSFSNRSGENTGGSQKEQKPSRAELVKEQKPSRAELVSEINNACYLYANSTNIRSQTNAIEDFVEFAQINESAPSIVGELQLAEIVINLNSSAKNMYGGNSSVSSKNIEANCISTLRKKAL